jgi:signal transduction histidine kinase
VRGRASAGAALFEVVDHGVGIPEEALPRVFERFVRRPHETGGTGLGLPIVKAIVEAHGGSVSVASSPADGTAVRLRLPGFRETAAAAAPARLARVSGPARA